MRKYISIVLLLFIGFSNKAQVNVDSIFTFVNQTNSNQQKVEALAEITKRPSEHKIKDLFKAIDLMAKIAADSQQTYILYCQNNVLGNYFRYIGSTPSALELFERNNEIAKEYALMPEYLNIGLIYQDQGDDSTAEEYFKLSIPLGQKYGLNNLAFAIYMLASRQMETNPDSSLMLIDSAIHIWKSLPYGPPDEVYFVDKREPGALPQAYFSLGSRALKLGDIEQAKAYVKEMEHWVKLDSTGHGRLYWLKVNLYLHSGQLDSALFFAKAAVEYHEKPDDKGLVHKSYEASSNKILSNVYYQLGNIEEAFRYFKRYEAIGREMKRNEGVRAIDLHKYQKKRERERLEAEAKQKIRSILAVAAVMVFLLIVFGLNSRLKYVRKTSSIIQQEKERSDNLLLNILPEEIAQELKEKGKADARDFDMVSILFTDFKSFTQASAALSAQELVAEINVCFEAFDHIIEKYNVEKIKTIGDAYMAAGGLPVPTDDSVKNTVLAALEMQAFISKRKTEMDATGKQAFEMRVGIHTGPVVAGIVGVKKFQYDIWGDTVNTAARMESSGEVSKVNISQATYELLQDDPDFAFENRGKIEVKGKGEINMYFVTRKTDHL